MSKFSSKKFLPSGSDRSPGAIYRRNLAKHPFLLFGLPFIGVIVAGSFWLTPATALRYEKHDRKVQRVSQEEALGLGKDRRAIDLKDEYYVSLPMIVEWLKADAFHQSDWQQRISTIGSKNEWKD